MVRLLFAPKENVHIFQGVKIIHGKPYLDTMGQLGCSSSLEVIGYRVDAEKYYSGSKISMMV